MALHRPSESYSDVIIRFDYARGSDVSYLRWQIQIPEAAFASNPSTHPSRVPRRFPARRSDLAKALGLGRMSGMKRTAAKKVSTKLTTGVQLCLGSR